ncbi:hypothetical protein GYMLUDRAFT_64181 [Collybiopsis luxurians FD-317 M1]|uniref:Uncharacterized protein n=1 Tax=Collybiopsis luxurians FD-317 M1 TaxID=944289 RepID=A0A0D0C420_9AGAR|nr:hypothetical protein GYMLUDRAFT_64181 [Collybiopsis luxurians FD-317 M1]
MEQGWERTPEILKHLNQDQCTLDRNFHIGQYIKNTDPNDISLVTDNGIGYFPDQRIASEYLAKMPSIAKKSTCNYLNVVNNQNKKKFKNMRYSAKDFDTPISRSCIPTPIPTTTAALLRTPIWVPPIFAYRMTVTVNTVSIFEVVFKQAFQNISL